MSNKLTYIILVALSSWEESTDNSILARSDTLAKEKHRYADLSYKYRGATTEPKKNRTETLFLVRITKKRQFHHRKMALKISYQ